MTLTLTFWEGPKGGGEDQTTFVTKGGVVIQKEVDKGAVDSKGAAKRRREKGPLWLNGAVRSHVRVGQVFQAEVTRVVDSIRPPPAPPPLCACGMRAAWHYRRWWCASEACEFEVCT